jgi:uncharacterized repeat protein (TIGR02543 family)
MKNMALALTVACSLLSANNVAQAQFADEGFYQGAVRTEFDPGYGLAGKPAYIKLDKLLYKTQSGCLFDSNCPGSALWNLGGNYGLQARENCGGGGGVLGAAPRACQVYSQDNYFALNQQDNFSIIGQNNSGNFWVAVANSEPSFDQRNSGAPGISEKIVNPLLGETGLYKVGTEDTVSGKRLHLIINHNEYGSASIQGSVPFLSVGAHQGKGQSQPIAVMNARKSMRDLLKFRTMIYGYSGGQPSTTIKPFYADIGVWMQAKWKTQGVERTRQIQFLLSPHNPDSPQQYSNIEELYNFKYAKWNWPLEDSLFYPGAEVVYLTHQSLRKCGIAIKKIPVLQTTELAGRKDANGNVVDPYEMLSGFVDYEIPVGQLFQCAANILTGYGDTASDSSIEGAEEKFEQSGYLTKDPRTGEYAAGARVGRFSAPMPDGDVELTDFHWFVETSEDGGARNKGHVWVSVENMRTASIAAAPPPRFSLTKTGSSTAWPVTTLKVGETVTTRWNASNAQVIEYHCTGPFTEDGIIRLPRETSSLTVPDAWADGVTTCEYTVTGLGGTEKFVETISATRAPPSLVLSYSGGGTVTGIKCDGSTFGPGGGGVCSQQFAAGTAVTLTATPVPGYAFTGWGGACSGTSPTCTVTVNTNTKVTATFAVASTVTFTVISPASNGGRVTGSGFNCGDVAGFGPVGGSVCTQQIAVGTTVTLTATPSTGNTFAGWSGACSGTAPTCTVTANANTSVTASFTGKLPKLTVTRSNQGGTVVGTGINCGADCSEEYPVGTQVTLTATASKGYVFSGWENACTGTAPTCTVTVKTNTAVFAKFNVVQQGQVVLTLQRKDASPQSAIYVYGPNTTCREDTCFVLVKEGTVVRLYAAPTPGDTFKSWSGACSGTAPTCTLTVTSDTAAVATFAGAKPTQGLSITFSSGGNVSSSSPDLNCSAFGPAGGGSCTQQVATGTAVTLTAKPTTGYTFAGWGGACSGTSLTCTVTVNSSTSVSANFALAKPTLTISPSNLGIVTGSGFNCSSGNAFGPVGWICERQFDAGTTVTLTASPNVGYTFAGWSGACSGTSPTCTVTVNSSTSVTPSFVAKPQPRLSITYGSGGNVTSSSPDLNCAGVGPGGLGGNCSQQVTAGTSVTLTAIPMSGYTFTGWGGACSGTSLTCTVTVNSDTSASVSFALAKPTLTITPSNFGTVYGADFSCTSGTGFSPGIVICSRQFDAGTTVTLNAIPNAGYAFTSWSGACSGTSPTCTLTLNGNTTVAPTFTAIPKPTLSVVRTPNTLVVGQPNTLTWSTNGTSLAYQCTATAPGFSETGTLNVPSGSITATALAEWVGHPTTCVYTATGPGGTTSVSETFSTVRPVVPPPTFSLNRTLGYNEGSAASPRWVFYLNGNFDPIKSKVTWSSTNAKKISQTCTAPLDSIQNYDLEKYGTGLGLNNPGGIPGDVTGALVGPTIRCDYLVEGDGGRITFTETIRVYPPALR